MSYKRFSLQRYSRETRFELPVSMKVGAQMAGSCRGSVQILAGIKDTAALSAKAQTLAILQPPFKAQASLTATTKAGLNIYQTMKAGGKLSAVSRLGCNIWLNQLFAASLSAFVSLHNLSSESAVILGEIPAGSELRIDCENYTVTLDGVNILHLQDGDWPQFSRELMSLMVGSGSGNTLEGRVMYRERWL